MTSAIFFINLAQIGMISTASSFIILHFLEIHLWDYDKNEVVKILQIVRLMGVIIIVFSILLFIAVSLVNQ